MDGITPTQKSVSVQIVMGMLILMVTPRRGATIPQFSAICVGLVLAMILARGERPLSFCSSRPLVAAST